ncbi:MAG: rRNA maturation RNase YbeY [Acholeplasmatales bacterium]|nr:rRNA maturation RNase YbeY [Acholeplasmatales bacterium]
MKVNFFNESKENVKEYQKLINRIFKGIGTNKEFNIIFVDSDEIRRINNEYRKIDKVTDVISFALCDDQDLIQTNELGDIFICVERAKEQALEYGHSEMREFAFLAVHGYLHLCGFDHQTEEEEKEMFKRQEEILNSAGVYR